MVGLICARKDGRQHPWPLPLTASSTPASQLWQSKLCPDTAKCPPGAQTVTPPCPPPPNSGQLPQRVGMEDAPMIQITVEIKAWRECVLLKVTPRIRGRMASRTQVHSSQEPACWSRAPPVQVLSANNVTGSWPGCLSHLMVPLGSLSSPEPSALQLTLLPALVP